MPKKKISESGDPLDITVTRKYPFNALSKVHVNRPGDSWSDNSITLDTDQVAFLWFALGTILGKNKPDAVPEMLVADNPPLPKPPANPTRSH